MSIHSEAIAAPAAHAAGAVTRAAWIAGAVLVAAAAYYFVGIDQGVVSVFGSDTHIHEMMHDGRHLLGFPCH